MRMRTPWICSRKRLNVGFSFVCQVYVWKGLRYWSLTSSGHVAILVMALLPLIGNLLATTLLLHSLKTVHKYHLEALAGQLEFHLLQESSRRLSVWNWWLLASFILFAALLTVLTVFQVSHDFHQKLRNRRNKNVMSGFPISGSDRVLIFYDHQLVFGLSGNHYQVCSRHIPRPPD